MPAAIFDRCGEPADVLRVDEVAIPSPAPGQVRVRMLASPINPSDLMFIRGVYGKQPRLPAIPGFEGVGVVEASAGGILGRFLMGKRVAVLNADGGNWAATAIVDAKKAIPLPGHLTLDQAAMFFVNPATAYVMTRKVLAVPPGAWLLQTAGGSALGRMVIRLGQHYGFRTLSLVRRPEQVAELKTAGGDEALAFEAGGDADAVVEQIRQRTGGGVRFAIDPVGGETGSLVVRTLAPQGRMLVYGTLSQAPLVFSPRLLMTPAASIEGFWLGPWMERQSLAGKLGLVRRLGALMRQGVLGSETGRLYPLHDVAQAVVESERIGRGGKTLLQIGDG